MQRHECFATLFRLAITNRARPDALQSTKLCARRLPPTTIPLNSPASAIGKKQNRTSTFLPPRLLLPPLLNSSSLPCGSSSNSLLLHPSSDANKREARAHSHFIETSSVTATNSQSICPTWTTSATGAPMHRKMFGVLGNEEDFPHYGSRSWNETRDDSVQTNRKLFPKAHRKSGRRYRPSLCHCS